MAIKLSGGLSVHEQSLQGMGLTPVVGSLSGRIGTASGGSGAKWGKIKGDINDQEDLMALFDNMILNCGTSTEVIGE